MDLEKLSPAPWASVQRAVPVTSDGHGFILADGLREVGRFRREVDCDFAALARNASDVRVRRGWYTVPLNRDGNRVVTWIAMNTFAVEIERGGNTGTYFVAEDPDTPLVEAERWYREHGM
jgi:hypothetical protein